MDEHQHVMNQSSGLSDLFSSDGFMPHGHCYLWKPELVWTHVTSDMLIGLAYISISLTLYALIRKIRLPFSTMVLSFGVFIAACGATHFMEVLTLWQPFYWESALVKILTALASVSTAVWLIHLAPKIVDFAATAKLAERNRLELQRTNNELRIRTEELQRTNQLLAEQQKVLAHSGKMSALGEMAGGIAHEINSPLAIIAVRAQQMERLQSRGQLTPETIQKESQLIGSTAKRIGDIIKGLRAFAREGEKDPFEITSIESIINDALVLCRTRFEAHGIKLDLHIEQPSPELECRGVQITQVLLNLLNNSFDALQKLKDRWVRIDACTDGNYIALSVTDSGRGIEPETAEKVMQPFFTTKEVGKGTGLGLSISKGIADSHNGTLEIDQASPNTRFVLTLPKQQT